MHVTPKSFVRSVANAGSRVQLTTIDLKVISVTFQAELFNTGIIYVGDNQVSSSNYAYGLVAGDSVSLDAFHLGSGPVLISLNEIWVDASSSGDDLIVSTLQRSD